MPFDVARLHKAVDWAKHEDRRKKRRSAITLRDQGDHTWMQQSWATVKLTAGWKRRTEKPKAFSDYVAVDAMSCGSTGCLAGHICVLAGDDYLIPENATGGETYTLEHVVDAEGNVHQIPERAAALLGTDWESLGNLFCGDNSIEDVEEIARRVTEDHGEVW